MLGYGMWMFNFSVQSSYYANLHSNWKSMRVSIVLHHHSITSHTVITRNYIIVLLANQLLSNSGHLLCSTLIPLPELAWPWNSQDSSNHRALICFLSLRECCSLMSSVMAFVIPYILSRFFCCCFRQDDKSGPCYPILARSGSYPFAFFSTSTATCLFFQFLYSSSFFPLD